MVPARRKNREERSGGRSPGRLAAVGCVAALLSVLALALLATPASSAVFPVCSLSTRLQVYITFNDASASPGAFTVAGCAYPFGYAVYIWFVSGSRPRFGDPIVGLPSTGAPLLLQSRFTDGHFHRTLVVPADAPDEIFAGSLLLTPYGAPTGYYYEASFAVRDPAFVPPSPEEAYSAKAPSHRDAAASVAWAREGAPAGAFTFFGTIDANGGHVRVWFEDAMNGSAIPGLYSLDAPWTGKLGNSRFALGFVLPGDLPIDGTQPNVRVRLQVLETGTVLEQTIWVHRTV